MTPNEILMIQKLVVAESKLRNEKFARQVNNNIVQNKKKNLSTMAKVYGWLNQTTNHS